MYQAFANKLSSKLPSGSESEITKKAIGKNTIGIVNKIGDLFGFGGGNDCTAAKKKKAKQIALDLQRYTSQSERAQFIRSTGSRTSRIPATPDGMARFYIGENDCKHKNVSKKHKRFINGLKPWINQRKAAKTTSQQAGAPYQGGTGTGAGSQVTNTMLIIAGVIAAIFFFNRNKQGAA